MLTIQSSKDYCIFADSQADNYLFDEDRSKFIVGIDSYLTAVENVINVPLHVLTQILKAPFENSEHNRNFLYAYASFWDDSLNHLIDSIELVILNPKTNYSKTYKFFNGYIEKTPEHYILGFNKEFIYACNFYIEEIKSSLEI